MLETGVAVEKDEHGAIFIDRSPKHFELILNYMRDGSVNIQDSKAATQEIQVEAQYYLLDGLVELCNTENSVTNEMKDCLKSPEEILIAATVSSSPKKNCTKT